MIDEKFLKVGQFFRGQIDGAIIEVVDITKGLKNVVKQSPTQEKTIYIYVKCPNGKIYNTNKENFLHLLLEPINDMGD